MTPKQKVLLVYPEAHSYAWAGPAYCIYPGTVRIKRGKRRPHVLNNSLNLSDRTARQAWAAAAKHPTVQRVGGTGA